jgi:hypothetical protein
MSVPEDQRDGKLLCAACGSPIPHAPIEINPYAPPSSPLEPDAEFAERSPLTQTSLLEKLAEAFRLLISNLGLFAALILTVWLPGNLVVNYIAYHGQDSENPLAMMRLNNLIETVFGPIYTGGMIFALARRKSGEEVTYAKAIAAGFHNWGRMFGTRFVTGLIVILGLIALIVPGIVVLLKYSLIDPVVVLEGTSGPYARQRSAALTKGKRWQILCGGLVYLLVVLPVSVGAGLALEAFEPLNTMGASVTLDCMLDILTSYIIILMFLFYWESVHSLDTETAAIDAA